MTTDRSFQLQVRARMARTGERYTTARAALLADRRPTGPTDGLLPGWSRTGGLQPDLAATANALAHVGAVRADGQPLDEVDVLGLSGGIGFMYGVFEWEGHGPTLTLTTRTDPMPDTTTAQALSRAGVLHEVQETGGAATARRHLDAGLEAARPLLVSLDGSHLPHRRGEATDDGGIPRVVGVVGRRGTDLLVDDQDPDPVVVPRADLEAGRSAPPCSRHRLVVVDRPDPGHDPAAAVRAALRRTVADYDTPPARPFASNVGTAGLEKWAALLVATGARSWERVFATEGHRALAYARTRACIDEDLTAPGAGRGLWATFVDRAVEVLDLPALAGVADAARTAEQRWVEIAAVAAAADPAADPAPVFASMAALVGEVATLERSLLVRLDDLVGS